MEPLEPWVVSASRNIIEAALKFLQCDKGAIWNLIDVTFFYIVFLSAMYVNGYQFFNIVNIYSFVLNNNNKKYF